MAAANPIGGEGDVGQAPDFSKLTMEQAFDERSSSERGLTSKDAADRLSTIGPNEITEKKKSPFLKFLGYFWGPIPFMIEIAVVLSAIIGHWEDFFIILALLATNAVVGFYQERKADNAIELLKERLASSAKVLRDGTWTTVPARELVPGDVVRVRLGDIVPADLKLFHGQYLEVDQSALTGESLPVEKAVGGLCYSGSIVRKGEMDGLVTVTGMHTFFGKTTKLVEEAHTVSHFQKNVMRIGNYLIMLDFVLVALIFVVALLRGESLLQTLQFALVLTIAAIPVAMPAVLSVSMAVGAIALARKGAIVSRLVAIEEMAGMDVLCSDKTGTITANQLSVAEVVGFDVPEDDVVLAGFLASNEVDKDPIDDAVIAKARSIEGLVPGTGEFQVEEFIPFDPVIKRTEAGIRTKKGAFRVAKGAPQVILEISSNKNQVHDRVFKEVDRFAESGFRSLGVMRKDGAEWKFIGLIGLHDPPRTDSMDTIQKAQEMGVTVKMVTGDQTAIAKEISKEVGLGTDIVSAKDFLKVPDDRAAEAVEKADGYAEVFPEHKYRIVELLQGRGHIVGMTGDGVNDAPALKKADSGIAVDGATDAAKSAASIVLTRPGLSVVVDAMVESRRIFQRMINYSVYRIAETIRVLFFITLSIIAFQFYPITAIMIVLLALLNDLPVLTISYDEVRYSARPEKWDMHIVLTVASFLGLIGVVSSFIVLYMGMNVFQLDQSVLQSFIYLKLSVAGHMTVLVARTKGHFWSVRPAWQLMSAILITQMIATLITVYGIGLPAMGWGLAAFIWGFAMVAFLITDLLKVRLYHYLIRKGEVTRGIA